MAVEVPLREIECNWNLYGDESSRVIKPETRFCAYPLHFFSITLVGLHAAKHDHMRGALRDLKQTIKPAADPDSWPHHFTKIWDSKPDSGGFALDGKAAKVEYAHQFATMLRTARPHLATFTFTSCFIDDDASLRRQRIKHQKEELFSFCLVSSLEQMRANKKGVRWAFDNIADASTGVRTEGWANEVFLGWQYTRLLQWIAAGSAVVEPAFTQPGSHFLSELADFLSFWVGREFDKHLTGAACECPTGLTGVGFYQFGLADGGFDFAWSNGLPLDRMLPKELTSRP